MLLPVVSNRRANVAQAVRLAATGAAGSFRRDNHLIRDDAIGGFLFFAPAFDFHVVENFSQRTAKKALQTAIFKGCQRSNRLFLVRFEELPAAFISAGVATNLREPKSIGGFLTATNA